MTEDNLQLRQTATGIVKRVTRKTILIVSIAVVISLLYQLVSKSAGPWWAVPASLAFGGALGLLNFRWLAVTVERVYVRQGVTATGANIAGGVINILKLAAIFVVLFIVIKWHIVNIIGLLVGLSLFFLTVVWEGLTVMTIGHR